MRLRLGTLSLRYRLFILAAAGIVPLALFAAFAVMGLVADRRQEAERSALELSRAIATAVRGELRSTLAGLEGLALAAQFDGGRVSDFDRVARRAVSEHASWRSVILTDPGGEVVYRTDTSGARSGGPVVDRESLTRVIESGQAVIGNLMRGPGGQYAIPLRVPVVRDGQLRYVLSVAIKPDDIVNILSMQKVPPSWVMAVLDANGIITARSRAQDEALGKPPSPSLRKLLSQGDSEGFRMTQTLEGDAAYTGIARIPDMGWTVAVGIPAAEVHASGHQSVAVYGAGIAASLLVSALLAWLLARGITEPVAELGRAAMALGHGQLSPTARCGIPEIDAVSRALEDAAAERTRAENDKEQLRAAEHEALQRAQQAARAKDEFLAMLGHELRNPLAPIVTTLELIRLRGDKQLEPQLQILKRQVSHMTRLVDDLLDVSRITAGRIEFDMQQVEFNGIVERALEAVAPLTSKREHGIELQLSPEPVWVEGDAVRLVQVVTNLLTNALKFTPAEGTISLRVEGRGNELIVTVQDSGVGIAPDLLPHVFEAFTQGQQALARRSGGLGLGLAIVRNLVRSHGGSVSAESGGTGLGSRFIVRLPAIRHDDAPVVQQVSGNTGVAGGNVLVVDDNFDAAATLASALELAGHTVRHVQDAASALRAFAEQPPEVAIFDIGLPDMDGHELAEAVRCNPAWRSCRLLALSGYGQEADKARALQAGFAEHVTKPVEFDVLEKIVASLLEESRLSADA